MAYDIHTLLTTLYEEESSASPLLPTARTPAQVITPQTLPMDWRIEWEERSAIKEYDGGMTRIQAETEALAEIANLIRTKNMNNDEKNERD